MKTRSAEKESDALKLLRLLWTNNIRTAPKDGADKITRGYVDYDDGGEQYLSGVLFVAAESGNTRFIVELLETYPDLIWKTNNHNRSIFHIALIHEIGSMKDRIIDLSDKEGNTILHLVGMTSVKMRPQTSGASLLMQRELLFCLNGLNTICNVFRVKTCT